MLDPTAIQRHYCDRAQKSIFETNELFLEFVKEGMTRSELQKNIDRRPQLWSRFSNWLDVLPE